MNRMKSDDSANTEQTYEVVHMDGQNTYTPLPPGIPFTCKRCGAKFFCGRPPSFDPDGEITKKFKEYQDTFVCCECLEEE